MDNEKEISFGAFDSELMHQEIFIPEGFTATIDGNKIILKKIEGEDEKVRKALIRFHKSTMDIDGIKGYEIVAWLEKQANHANFRNKIQIGDKVTRNRDGVLVNLSQLNRVAKKDENQGESYTKKDVDNAYVEGIAFAKNELEKQGEQKSAAWSEEDEIMIANIRDDLFCYQTKVRDEDHQLAEDIEKERNWLKSIKKRIGG